MSRPPRGRGGFRGRGPPGRGGSFGGRGRGRGGYDEGPPSEVVELGIFVHACEGEMVYKLTNSMVPYFNAGAYLENKTKIGKVDEILGPINGSYFTVKPDGGVNATSFKDGDKVFIGPDKLLPMSRFTGASD
ncbi:H/ACA ribonucleoprotein complex, subunit Gar1/Naf1 [Tribonema minus]|uniref:H/ACA ribonucleoprotein complex subunit n=1 Tax=Tribonema minus TaxID=303371 RepID=A0A835YSJ1_9STRA|nr:H/ACA ribonucleoprotein complex, subunit Gar1/Naf1 [Tribonema minus]